MNGNLSLVALLSLVIAAPSFGSSATTTSTSSRVTEVELASKYALAKQVLNATAIAANASSCSSEALQVSKDLFGLSGEISELSIKNAYREQVRRFHPDKVKNLGDESTAMATEVTKAAGHAKSVLLLERFLRSNPWFERQHTLIGQMRLAEQFVGNQPDYPQILEAINKSLLGLSGEMTQFAIGNAHQTQLFKLREINSEHPVVETMVKEITQALENAQNYFFMRSNPWLVHQHNIVMQMRHYAAMNHQHAHASYFVEASKSLLGLSGQISRSSIEDGYQAQLQQSNPRNFSMNLLLESMAKDVTHELLNARNYLLQAYRV